MRLLRIARESVAAGGESSEIDGFPSRNWHRSCYEARGKHLVYVVLGYIAENEFYFDRNE